MYISSGIAAFWKRQREAWERQNITKTGFIEHEDPYHENQSLRSPNRLFVGGVSGGSVSIRDTVIRERQQPDVQVGISIFRHFDCHIVVKSFMKY